MRNVLTIVATILVSLLVMNWVLEHNTQVRANEVVMTLKESAPIGRSRINTQNALAAKGLEYVYGVSGNALYGKKRVGRYRLIYVTEINYTIHLDEKAQVIEVEWIEFNEGL